MSIVMRLRNTGQLMKSVYERHCINAKLPEFDPLHVAHRRMTLLLGSTYQSYLGVKEHVSTYPQTVQKKVTVYM